MGIFQQLHERLFFLGSIFNRSDTGNRSQVLHDIDNQIMKKKINNVSKVCPFFSPRENSLSFWPSCFFCAAVNVLTRIRCNPKGSTSTFSKCFPPTFSRFTCPKKFAKYPLQGFSFKFARHIWNCEGLFGQ